MTSGITVRDAVADDLPILLDFLVKLDAHVAGVAPDDLALTTVGEQQLQDRLLSFVGEAGKRMVVACGADGRPVGMGGIHVWHYADIWLNPERQGQRSGYIDDLWIEPEARGSGVARMISAALIDYAAEQGIDELILEYALHNKDTAAFWERLGFAPTGVRAAANLSSVRRCLSCGRGD